MMKIELTIDKDYRYHTKNTCKKSTHLDKANVEWFVEYCKNNADKTEETGEYLHKKLKQSIENSHTSKYDPTQLMEVGCNIICSIDNWDKMLVSFLAMITALLTQQRHADLQLEALRATKTLLKAKKINKESSEMFDSVTNAFARLAQHEDAESGTETEVIRRRKRRCCGVNGLKLMAWNMIETLLTKRGLNEKFLPEENLNETFLPEENLKFSICSLLSNVSSVEGRKVYDAEKLFFSAEELQHTSIAAQQTLSKLLNDTSNANINVYHQIIKYIFTKGLWKTNSNRAEHILEIVYKWDERKKVEILVTISGDWSDSSTNEDKYYIFKFFNHICRKLNDNNSYEKIEGRGKGIVENLYNAFKSTKPQDKRLRTELVESFKTVSTKLISADKNKLVFGLLLKLKNDKTNECNDDFRKCLLDMCLLLSENSEFLDVIKRRLNYFFNNEFLSKQITNCDRSILYKIAIKISDSKKNSFDKILFLDSFNELKQNMCPCRPKVTNNLIDIEILKIFGGFYDCLTKIEQSKENLMLLAKLVINLSITHTDVELKAIKFIVDLQRCKELNNSYSCRIRQFTGAVMLYVAFYSTNKKLQNYVSKNLEIRKNKAPLLLPSKLLSNEEFDVTVDVGDLVDYKENELNKCFENIKFNCLNEVLSNQTGSYRENVNTVQNKYDEKNVRQSINRNVINQNTFKIKDKVPETTHTYTSQKDANEKSEINQDSKNEDSLRINKNLSDEKEKLLGVQVENTAKLNNKDSIESKEVTQPTLKAQIMESYQKRYHV